MIKSLSPFLFFAVLLAACSGLEQSQQQKVRQKNAQVESIYRNQSDQTYVIDTPAHRVREAYPWESDSLSKFPKITKEYFRCRGSSLNPAKVKDNDPSSYLHDCDGLTKHSLPIREGKEFIYPILLDLLNYIQNKTHHKVVITSGHRCPAHNTYADGSTFNLSSKHMIGAEVDFYVEGMESSMLAVVDLIMQYYKEQQIYKGQNEYERFLRLDSKLTNVITQPWYNKEILIKLYQKGEGRDFDNKHPHPYISLQVRFDRESSDKVVYSWDKAFKGFLRY